MSVFKHLVEQKKCLFSNIWFKATKTPNTALAAARSISQDSIFSPSDRAEISRFPKPALSEDSIPQSAFQSELLSKLSKRRSLYSDDDRDEGLPRSPVPPVTTADVIMGGPLKSGPSDKKSSNRDSDQSLISVDGSENEEDLFQTNWKKSVPAKISGSEQKKGKKSEAAGMDQLDFSSIQKTEVLDNAGAKDRISLKPKTRKASRQSRKNRDVSTTQSLPSLNEESPTRTISEINYPQEVPLTPGSQKVALTPTEDTPAPAVVAEVKATNIGKLNLASINTSSKGDKTTVTSPTSSTNGSKVSTPTSPTAKSGPTPGPKFAGSTIITTHGQSSPVRTESPVVQEKPFVDPSFNNKYLDVTSLQKDKGEDKPVKEIHAPQFEENMTMSKSPSLEASLKVSDPDSNVTMSPKEDYKQRRQGRSKTLPVNTEDQVSPRVQRANSHRVQSSNSPEHSVSPPLSLPVDKTLPAVKKLDNTKFGSLDSTADLMWLERVRKKQEEENSRSASFDSPVTTSKPAANLNAPKSVFSSASYLEKKRGSIETISVKTRDGAESVKKQDSLSSDTKTNQPSSDTVLARKESFDIELTDVSVKPTKSSFSANRVDYVKPVGQKDVKVSVPSVDRAKLLYGSQSMASLNTVKPSPNMHQEPGVEETPKPSGISHFKSGSIKSSPVKTADSSATGPSKAPLSVTSSMGFKMSSASSGSNKLNKADMGWIKDNHGQSSDPAVTTAPHSASPAATAAVTSTTASKPLPSTHPTPFAFTPKPISSVIPPASKPANSPTSPPTVAFGVKPSSFKALSSDTANVSSTLSSSSSSSVVTPSSSSTQTSSVPSSTPSSTSSTSISQSRPSSTRTPSTFTSSSISKPQVSNSNPSVSSRSTTITTSPSFKSTAKPAQDEKKPVLDVKKPVLEEKKSESAVPAWRSSIPKPEVPKAEVKIEIIEKSSQSNADLLRKTADKTNLSVKKNDSSSSTMGSKLSSESSSNRSSRVLDMVKNFQSHQVST
ncbi:serine-rich adhesin for platelets-like [Physella acuta]|uniref:serine-rich adhesin for platelets-like n=1 Tax=Physella acuta TaxID=109671 RepID=UPI0027DE3400|nr:serine-rich adhesin for platelets-like [Physella acuta]